MLRLRPRLTVGGLMILIAVAAIVTSRFRPMSQRDAARLAIEIVHADQGPYRLVDDPIAPTAWRVVGAAVRQDRGYAVHLEPDEESPDTVSPDGYYHNATIWIDAGNREPYMLAHGRESPSVRAHRLAQAEIDREADDATAGRALSTESGRSSATNSP